MRLPRPYGHLALPVYLPSFFMALGQESLLVLLPLYVIDLGYSAAFAALIVGLRGIGILIFDIPAGMLVTRFGDKPVLLGGVGGVLIGMLLLTLSSHPFVIAVAALLLGCGFAAWMLGRQSYVADTCRTEETGRAIAVMAGIQRGGAFVGPALAGFVALGAGYPVAFTIGAFAALTAVVCVLKFAVEIVPESERGDQGLRGAARILREQRRAFATAGVAAMSLQLMRASRQLLVPLFGAAIGLDVAFIGMIYSASAAIDMCLFYPMGLLIDRRGRKWSALPTMVLFASALALLPLADNVLEFAAVTLTLGLANGLGTGIVMILGADLSRKARQRSQFLGVWRVMGDSGVSGAPFITGAIISVASLAAASTAIAVVGFLGAGLMAFCVTETLDRAPPKVRN